MIKHILILNIKKVVENKKRNAFLGKRFFFSAKFFF